MAFDLSALRARAAGQHGCFTFAQVLACGGSRRTVRTAIAAALWSELGRGVYAETALVETLAAEPLHLCQVRARLLELRGEPWVAARRSAALAFGLPLLGAPPPRPQLLRAKEVATDRGRNRFERRASLPSDDVTAVHGIQGTVLERTVIDLARDESFRSGLVVADAALRQGLHRERLLGLATRCAGWPGGLQGVRVARFADGRAESPLESISRWRLEVEGLPAPELQVEVWLGREFLARVDFLWERSNLIGEADGKAKYLVDPERGYTEKRQRERLENLGFVVVAWSWEDAYRDSGELARVVGRGLARGALNTIDPRVRLVRTTAEDAVRRNRRSA